MPYNKETCRENDALEIRARKESAEKETMEILEDIEDKYRRSKKKKEDAKEETMKNVPLMLTADSYDWDPKVI